MKSILESIGNTPLIRLVNLPAEDSAEVWGKAEFLNPGGSVKDRIALSMIEEAEKLGYISAGSTIIEPTSGNTGIGLAMICAVKGYRCIITMPKGMSLERIFTLEAYGAEVVLTDTAKGMAGAIDKAESLCKKMPKAFVPHQFNNLANPRVHRETTAKEILKETNGNIDAFVAGVGTGGTITGVGEVLKEHNSKIKIIAVEPKASAVLSGTKPGPHKIQGIGAGFVPAILNRKIIDEIITISDDEAFSTTRKLSTQEGLFCGMSSGAAVAASLIIAKKLGKGKRVVTVLPDTGGRYFSAAQYFEF